MRLHCMRPHCSQTLHPFNARRPGNFWPGRTLKVDRLYTLDISPPASPPVDVPVGMPIDVPIDTADTALSLQPIALLEAALFLAKEPMPSRRLAQMASLPEGTKTRQLIRELNKRYETEQSSICIVEVAEGFQLRTRPEFAPWLVKIQGVHHAVRLSNPAMETLTVIAYRQPVPRADIERIRGVQCGDLIKQLLDQGLAKVVGRSEELGRPFLYGTTSKFLRVFGLNSLQDLPPIE